MIKKELNKIMILTKDNIPQIENLLNGVIHDALINECCKEVQDTNKKWIKKFSAKIVQFEMEYIKATHKRILVFPNNKVLSTIYRQINEDLPYEFKISNMTKIIELITKDRGLSGLKTVSIVTYLRDKFDNILNSISFDDMVDIIKDSITTEEVPDRLVRLIEEKLSHQTQDNSKQSINLADQNTQQPILS